MQALTIAFLVALTAQLNANPQWQLGESVRRPKVRPNPLDYELSMGYKSPSEDHWLWYERTNGEEYTGVDLRVKLQTDHVENSWAFEHRQFDGILRGCVTLSLKCSVMRLGIMQSWDHYEPATSGLVGVETTWLSARLSIYPDGVESAKVNAHYQYPLSNRLDIGPMVLYSRDRVGNWDFQEKLVLTWWPKGRPAKTNR